MAVRLEGWAREMLERPRGFATLATLTADGSPHQAVIWFGLSDDTILVNSAVGRRWPTNLIRDPRFSFMLEHDYDWVAIRGRAELLHDPERAQEDIAAMARRYHEDDPDKAERIIRDRFQQQERISFVLRPAAVFEHPDL
ncbi:MAG: TIGR03618 family F420-dependent PPOX class oxidoreductase [Chloroflexota bacterium]